MVYCVYLDQEEIKTEMLSKYLDTVSAENLLSNPHTGVIFQQGVDEVIA